MTHRNHNVRTSRRWIVRIMTSLAAFVAGLWLMTHMMALKETPAQPVPRSQERAGQP